MRKPMVRYAPRKSESMSIDELRSYATKRGFVHHVDCPSDSWLGPLIPYEVLSEVGRKFILRSYLKDGYNHVFLAFRDSLLATLFRLNYGLPEARYTEGTCEEYQHKDGVWAKRVRGGRRATWTEENLEWQTLGATII